MLYVKDVDGSGQASTIYLFLFQVFGLSTVPGSNSSSSIPTNKINSEVARFNIEYRRKKL
jgi:hypothetical protein